ncbi:MAG: hypothetical protein ACLR1V_14570 [Coprococcus sp.]
MTRKKRDDRSGQEAEKMRYSLFGHIDFRPWRTAAAERTRHCIGFLISAIKPDYVGFLTLMIDPQAPVYSKIVSGELELLNPEDVVEEMKLFLQNVDSEGTVFRSNHASNYVILKGTLNEDIPSMMAYLRQVEEQGKYREERWRRF